MTFIHKSKSPLNILKTIQKHFLCLVKHFNDCALTILKLAKVISVNSEL